MIKIAVCDDEKNIRNYLISLIREQNIECEASLNYTFVMVMQIILFSMMLYAVGRLLEKKS